MTRMRVPGWKSAIQEAQARGQPGDADLTSLVLKRYFLRSPVVQHSAVPEPLTWLPFQVDEVALLLREQIEAELLARLGVHAPNELEEEGWVLPGLEEP